MASADEAEIFDAHLLFLKDDALLGRPGTRSWTEPIGGPGLARRDRTDGRAVDALDDEYLRARATDLERGTAGTHGSCIALPGPELEAPGVVIARDLTPADTVGLDPSMALGIVTAAGGPTSHAAVLARSTGIPAVVGAGGSVLTVPEGTPIALDGSTGVVHVDPDPSVVPSSPRRAMHATPSSGRRRRWPLSPLARSTV
jgi:phosphocarrier protein FPr